MTDQDGDGFRDWKSFKPFVISLDLNDWGGSLKVQTDAAAEMKVQWENNLKLKLDIKNVQGLPEADTRNKEGQYMLKVAHISEIDIWTFPDWVFPIRNRYIFPLEGRWVEKGGEACTPDPNIPYDCGVKPEPGSPAEKLDALYVKGVNTKTIEDRHKIFYEAVKVWIEEGPFVIGLAGDQPMPIYVQDYMRNIYDYGVVGPWAPATPGSQLPATWWMDK
jgi:peptide/nickel transport system substrate-binding protein